MALDIHARHLIDRYLNGELSGIELDEFKRKLTDDIDFKKVVELQQVIYSGIVQAREEAIQNKIRASLKYRKPVIPFALKLIIAFFIILTLGITFWSYIGNEFERSKPYNNFISIFKRDTKQEAPEKKNKSYSSKGETQQQETTTSVDSTVQDSSALSAENKAAIEGNAEEDIEVKKDVMISSIVLPVIDKGMQKDESSSKDIAKKLPDADLPVEEKVDSFIVEFWVSPIHYKGYKMSKNKIVLFGLENIDALKLYRINSSIYMNDEESYYMMASTYDFMPYQKLKELEIPQELK
jgi:hypothetical protein